MIKQKLLNIDTSYQPFFFVTTDNEVLISNPDWPTPVPMDKDWMVNTHYYAHHIAYYLLSKIMFETIEAENIHLPKQTIYDRTRYAFKNVARFDEALKYLNLLNYLRVQNGGVSGRKKIVVLNPKVLDDFYV